MSTDPSVWDEIRRCEEQYERNPESLVFARLADAYRKAGEFDLALKVIADGISRHPDYASGHIVLGRCHRDLDSSAEAVAAFEKVAQLDPANLVAVRSLAELSREQGDQASARAWYTQLSQLDPTNDETSRILASLGGPIEAPGAADLEGAAEEDDQASPFVESTSFADPTPLPGRSAWPDDLSDTPEPINLGDSLGDLDLEESRPLVGDGELLDWSTGELLQADADVEPPTVSPVEDQSLETAGSSIDDKWLQDLDQMMAPTSDEPVEDSESPLEIEPSFGVFEPDPAETPPSEVSDDWLSAPGPLDAIDPGPEADADDAPEALPGPMDWLGATDLPGLTGSNAVEESLAAEPEPAEAFEVAEVAEVAEVPEVLETTDVQETTELSEAAEVSELADVTEALEVRDAIEILEVVGEPDAPEEVEMSAEPEPAEEPESSPDPAPDTDAPWWEELAKAGLNVGGAAEIESLVEAEREEPADGGDDGLAGPWLETDVEPQAPEPAVSEDADIMTRTMADLYVDQGLYEEAIEIYEELMVDRPDDADLRARLEDVRARRGSGESAPESESEAALEPEIAAQPFDGDDTIPLAAYQPAAFEPPADVEPVSAEPEASAEPAPVPEPEPETGPWIADELLAILRAGDSLADEHPDDPSPEAAAPTGGILEEWLRRLEQ